MIDDTSLISAGHLDLLISVARGMRQEKREISYRVRVRARERERKTERRGMAEGERVFSLFRSPSFVPFLSHHWASGLGVGDEDD